MDADVELDEGPAEITSLVGREVYSNNGMFVGEVEDVQLNLDKEQVTGIAVTNLNGELFNEEATTSRGVLVPYRWVRSVGDIVLVSEVVERVHSPEEDDAETTTRRK